MGLEHSETSVSARQAEDAGEPTARWSVDGPPLIGFRIVTKPVLGLPWRRGVKYNYFFAYLIVEGAVMDPRVSWSRSPREAMEKSLRWWTTQIIGKLPCDEDLFEGAHRLRTDNSYWVIEGTHE